jgi:hypothetical protein
MDIGQDLAEPVARADLKAEADASAESSRKEYLMVSASVSTFRAPPPGCYTKSLMPKLIRKTHPEDLRASLRAIREMRAKSWSGGVAVGKYMQGKYTRKGRACGKWFPCRVTAKEEGGWRVVWGDGDQHDTLKTTEHLRDSV